jgi:hypothetical protein
MATVRGTITSAEARTSSNSVRAAQPGGAVPARTCSTGMRSSSCSIVMAVGSENLRGAIRPCAAARPWQTSTAVRLAR